MRKPLLQSGHRSTWILVAAALLLLGGVSALTNTNSVSGTKSGDGTNVITGYVLSAIQYTLNAASPQNVDSVTWTLDSTPPTGSVIRARFSTTGNWYTCSFVGTTTTCGTSAPQLTASGVSNLRVVIAQ